MFIIVVFCPDVVLSFRVTLNSRLIVSPEFAKFNESHMFVSFIGACVQLLAPGVPSHPLSGSAESIR